MQRSGLVGAKTDATIRKKYTNKHVLYMNQMSSMTTIFSQVILLIGKLGPVKQQTIEYLCFQHYLFK